ncbi:MAG: hypothetical protein VX777_05380 [Chlamydiota bacterium]|nr:hypothetical protein [Chlamydiota bacterium]
MNFESPFGSSNMQPAYNDALKALNSLENSINNYLVETKSENSLLDDKVQECASKVMKIEKMIENFENALSNDLSVLGYDFTASLISNTNLLRQDLKDLTSTITPETKDKLSKPLNEARSALKEYAATITAKQSNYLSKQVSHLKEKSLWDESWMGNIHEKIDGLVDHQKVYQYGRPKKAPWHEVPPHEKGQPLDTPKLPRRAKIGKTSKKVTIERTQILCKNLRQALIYHRNHLSHNYDSLDVVKAMGELYSEICNFQEYIDNDLASIKGTYLNQAKELKESVTFFYSHDLDFAEQSMFNRYFKPLTEELTRLHKKLS